MVFGTGISIGKNVVGEHLVAGGFVCRTRQKLPSAGDEWSGVCPVVFRVELAAGSDFGECAEPCRTITRHLLGASTLSAGLPLQETSNRSAVIP